MLIVKIITGNYKKSLNNLLKIRIMTTVVIRQDNARYYLMDVHIECTCGYILNFLPTVYPLK